MATDHGAQIKDDAQYEALRDKGMSKNKAARIANANAQGGGRGQRQHGRQEDQGRDEPGVHGVPGTPDVARSTQHARGRSARPGRRPA